MKVQFISIIPTLKDRIGHVYDYHRFLQKAVHSNGWEFRAIIPERVDLQELDFLSEKVIPNDYQLMGGNHFRRLVKLIAYARRLSGVFQRSTGTTKVLFIEHFTIFDLAALWMGVLTSRRKVQLWILNRYSFEENRLRRWIHSVHYALFRAFLGKDSFKLLTDSELLAIEHSAIFKMGVDVLPIPHASVKQAKNVPPNPKTLFWLPGNPRPEKGASDLNCFFNGMKKHRGSTKLAIGSSARQLFGEEADILYLPIAMDREEYEEWFSKAEVILLPYKASLYQKRSSGIFIEAISSGKILFTTKGTWMEYELKKYGLDELAVDWYGVDVFDEMQRALASKKTREKLRNMQKEYEEFHHPASIQKLFLHWATIKG